MFPCTKCGICCQNISFIDELKDYDMGNGVCKYFNNITKSCAVYESRPDICKIDKMYELKFHTLFTKNEFYKLNAYACNEMQKNNNIEKIFRVEIGE